ncbi:hypothetical protein [Halobacillus sp. Marseille-P3879]|uniref:hypothetical protein n=1 Tax=Halobacillus TaxID=45667 RepID=UPI00135A6F90|nr:hypothetical protein [Halobacillus sp. Marseille-P3879]
MKKLFITGCLSITLLGNMAVVNADANSNEAIEEEDPNELIQPLDDEIMDPN